MRRVVVDLGPRVEAIKAIARGLCRSSSPHPDCLCGGNPVRCHAVPIYHDMALSALRAMEAEGMTVSLPPPPA